MKKINKKISFIIHDAIQYEPLYEVSGEIENDVWQIYREVLSATYTPTRDFLTMIMTLDSDH